MRFDPFRARLDIDVDGLRSLVLMACGDLDPADAGPQWGEAGIVVGSQLHPVVAGLAKVAIAPHRAVAIERLTEHGIAPLHIGWESNGRATLTEAGRDGEVAITATHLELLPALVLQALRFRPGAVVPGRAPVRVETDDLADLPVAIGQVRHAWRATGSWQAASADGSATVVDAGERGLWFGEPDPHDGHSLILVPAPPDDVVDRLGDIVTGRRSPLAPAAVATLA